MLWYKICFLLSVLVVNCHFFRVSSLQCILILIFCVFLIILSFYGVCLHVSMFHLFSTATAKLPFLVLIDLLQLNAGHTLRCNLSIVFVSGKFPKALNAIIWYTCYSFNVLTLNSKASKHWWYSLKHDLVYQGLSFKWDVENIKSTAVLNTSLCSLLSILWHFNGKQNKEVSARMM